MKGVDKEFLIEKHRLLNTALSLGLMGSAALAGGQVYNRLAPVTDQAPVTTNVDVTTPATVTTGTNVTTAKNVTTEPTYAHETIKNMIIGDEGIKTKMYKDSRKINTVGVGHNLENTKQSKASFNTAFGDNGPTLRNHVIKGGELTHPQARKLFDADYQEHLDRTIKFIPNLHEHPPDVQAVLVSGTYRGHVGDSPKFRKLFNSAQEHAEPLQRSATMHQAAKEFLDRDDYNHPDPNARGVVKRLDRDANILRNYADTIKQ